MSLAKIHYRLQWDDRGNELIVAEDTLEGVEIEHPPGVKDLSPSGTPYGLCFSCQSMIKHQYPPTGRAGVERSLDIELAPAPQAPIKHGT